MRGAGPLKFTDRVRDKIRRKHGVTVREVREAHADACQDPTALRNKGRDGWHFFGVTEEGRYLRVVAYEHADAIWVATALPMSAAERRYYGGQKNR